MVGNRMTKIGIILLTAFIMAASVCACENLETGSSELSIGSRISESRYFSFTDIIVTKNYIVENLDLENLDLELGLPARQTDNVENRQPAVQNNQLVFRRESPKQMPPAFSREESVRKGIPDREELDKFMENQSLQYENVTSTSNYQMYVTPNAEAVESYLEENDLDDKYEIYDAALSWTWVSDETLNGEEEKWLIPTEFLEETPSYSSNPVYGEPASDCEEQANTLASLLIASGEYNESTVRVAIGKVDFGEVSGGHAWVEVYEDDEWFPLDPTDGPYYDDDSSELIPANSSEVDYYEYRDSTYPVVEIWYYYNDEYFIDLGTQSGNAPVSWNNIPENYRIKSGRF